MDKANKEEQNVQEQSKYRSDFYLQMTFNSWKILNNEASCSDATRISNLLSAELQR